MQQLGPDLPMAQCQGPRAQTVSLFLVFTHIRQEDVAIISKVPPPPHPPRAMQIQPKTNMVSSRN